MHTARTALLALLLAATLAGQELAPITPELGSYYAHVAAAANALELDRASEARRWLAAAPAAPRGWEWHYLARQARQDRSSWAEAGTPILALTASADGRRLAAGSAAGEVLLWDLAESRLAGRAAAHAGKLTSLVFAPDGGRLLTIGSDRVLRLWSLPTLEKLAEQPIAARSLLRAAWSPDGRQIAVSAWEMDPETRRPRGFVLLFDDGRLDSPRRLEAPYPVVAGLVFSPDSVRLAAVTWGEQPVVYDLPTGVPQPLATLAGGMPPLQDVAFSPDGRRLAAGSKDGSILIWDAASRAVERVLSPEGAVHRGWVNSVAFSADGSRLFSASSDETVRVWDPASGRLFATLHGHDGAIHALIVAGGTIWSGSDDGTVRSWEPPPFAGLRQETPEGEFFSFWGFAFSRDGRLAATAGSDGKITVWDLPARRPRWSFAGHEDEADAVTFSADGVRLFSSANDGKLREWEVTSGKLLRELEDVDDGRAVELAVSPDGARLAAGSSSGTAKVWSLATGIPEKTLAHGKVEVWQPVWSPDGRWLATTGRDGVAKLWDVSTGALLTTLEGHGTELHGASFSPDGRRLATASLDRTVRLWSLPDGRQLAVLRGHSERVYDVVFSPDGRRLATVSEDFTARLWDAATGAQVLRLGFSPHQTYKVRWSDDGHTLAVVPMDGTVRLLDGSPVP